MNGNNSINKHDDDDDTSSFRQDGEDGESSSVPRFQSIPWQQPISDEDEDDKNRDDSDDEDDDDSQRKGCKDEKKKIRLLVCSGNLGNQQPDAASLAAWIPADGDCRPVMVVGNSPSPRYPLRCYPKQPAQQNAGAAASITETTSQDTENKEETTMEMTDEGKNPQIQAALSDPTDSTILQQFDLIVIGMQEATFDPPPSTSVRSPQQQSAYAVDDSIEQQQQPQPTVPVPDDSDTERDMNVLPSPSAATTSTTTDNDGVQTNNNSNHSEPPSVVRLQIPVVQPLMKKGLQKTVGTIATFTANRDYTKQHNRESYNNNKSSRSIRTSNSPAAAAAVAGAAAAVSSAAQKYNYNMLQIPLTEWNGGTKVLHQLLRARLPSYRHVVSFQRGQMRLEVFALSRNHRKQRSIVEDEDDEEDSDDIFQVDDTDSDDEASASCPVKVLQTSAQNTGLAGLANKGGIATELWLPKHKLRLSFVTCHLEAHEGLQKYQIRCNSMADILNGTTPKKKSSSTNAAAAKESNEKNKKDKPSSPTAATASNNNQSSSNVAAASSGWHDVSISSHYCFVMGDLNFRTDACRFDRKVLKYNNDDAQHNQLIRRWTKERNWEALNAVDELHHALRNGDVLQGGFQTLFCNFPPTFKLARQAGFWDKELPDLHVLKRRPSYTDRIVWKSNHEYQSGIAPMIYEPIDAFASSDHKPIRGAFEITAPEPFLLPSKQLRGRRERAAGPHWLRKSIIRRAVSSNNSSPSHGQHRQPGSSMLNLADTSTTNNSLLLRTSKKSSLQSLFGRDDNSNNNHHHASADSMTPQARHNNRHRGDGKADGRLELFVSNLSCEIYHEKELTSPTSKAPPNPYVVLVSSPEEALRHFPQQSFWTRFKQSFHRIFIQPFNCASHEHFMDQDEVHSDHGKKRLRQSIYTGGPGASTRTHGGGGGTAADCTKGTCMRTGSGWPRTSRKFATFEPSWGEEEHATDHVAVSTQIVTHRVDGSPIDLTGALLHLTLIDFKTNAEDVVIGTCTFNLANLLRKCCRPKSPSKPKPRPARPQSSSLRRRMFRSGPGGGGDMDHHSAEATPTSTAVSGAAGAVNSTAVVTTAASSEATTDDNNGVAPVHRHGPFQSVMTILRGSHSGSILGFVPESIQEEEDDGGDDDDDAHNPVSHYDIDGILVKNGRETGSIRCTIEGWWMDAATAHLIGTIPALIGHDDNNTGDATNPTRRRSGVVLSSRHQRGRRASVENTAVAEP